MFKSLLLLLVISIVAMGCATPVTPVPVGGSRADGTVTLAYEYGSFQRPQVDWGSADWDAHQRCTAWGYSHAEMFAPMQQCLNADVYGNCNRWRVNVTYQCTND